MRRKQFRVLPALIVPIRSPQAIAEKLVWLYEHPEARAEMRRAALRRVKSIGGWDRYGERMLETFHELVATLRVEKEVRAYPPQETWE